MLRPARKAPARQTPQDRVLVAISVLRAVNLIVPSAQWTLQPDALADKVPEKVLRAVIDAVPQLIIALFTLRVRRNDCTQEVFVTEIADLLMQMVGIQQNRSAMIMSSGLAVLLGQNMVATYAALALYAKGDALATDQVFEDGETLYWMHRCASEKWAEN